MTPSRRMLALGGGAGSGKSSIARALAATLPGTGLVHLDDWMADLVLDATEPVDDLAEQLVQLVSMSPVPEEP